MALALATSIPVAAWAEESTEVILTALEIMDEQRKAQ